MTQTHGVSRRAAGAIAATLACFALSAAPSTAAAKTLTISGVVACSSGAVSGIWVASSKGGSKFASWRPMKMSARYASYAAKFNTGTPTKIQLRVGCGHGNKPGEWKTTNKTSYRTTSSSRVWNAFCNAAGKCSWPATGNKASRNGGVAKYCTWGALDQWKRYAGYYPSWSGNAAQWPTTAKQNRWTVTRVPMPKAMVVMDTVGAGHVGWVNALGVSKKGDVSLSITEMNYDGTVQKATGNVRTKTYKASPSYWYIPVP